MRKVLGRVWKSFGQAASSHHHGDAQRSRALAGALAVIVLVSTSIVAVSLPAVASDRVVITASTPPSPSDFANGDQTSSDIAIDGVGDADGYHVRVAQESAGFAWRDLAVIKPANLDEAHWYGYQCLSSDGLFAAVAILPGTLENNAAGRNRGAFAYAIEVATGKVTPLATGVGSMYYSPSCGIDDSAVFTASLGDDEQTTQLLRVDLATGKQVSQSVVEGQVTSSVALGSRIVGAFRSTLVEIAAGGSLDHPLHPTKTADLAGLAYQIRPSQDGGIDFLTTDAKQKVSTVWHQANAPPTSLGSGPTQRVNIFLGRHGHNTVLGATSLKASHTLRLEAATKLPLTVQTVSLDADAAFGPQKTQLPSKPSNVETNQTTTASSTSALEALKTHHLFKSTYVGTSSGSTNQIGAQLPGQGPAISGGSSRPSPKIKTAAFIGTGAATSGYSGNISLASVASVAPATLPMLSAGATTPKCSIGRLLPTEQAVQPSNAQVNWAVQMAERGLLTGSAYTRPANYASMGLVAYAPSSDFPPVSLSHPSSSTTTAVPRSVMEAIMAQESNFDQASWHAISGVSADPLIADYYGSANGISSIYYPSADCGYGISQVTTGMAATDTSLSLHGQMKVAADYEENITAGLQILEKIWNQLYASGTTANGGDPKYLENWFFAAWAYNSGIQPTAAFGNTTGCTPSATCAGPDGTWGLGWSNNPANPNYNPARAPFLQTSYADAAHPSNWPYEERIMGFMASALARNAHTAYATPTYQGGKTWIQIPSPSYFCTTGNDCSATPAYHCTLADSECWTHTPVTWVTNCSTTCATSDYDVATTSTEPVFADPYPPECQLDVSQVPTTPSGAPIVVDDLATPSQNRAGCGAFNWANGGTFSMSPGTNSSGDPIGNIDLHQLGAGFGGHLLFTHGEDGSNSSLIDTGTWTPTLPSNQYYQVMVHIPDIAAVLNDAVYTIHPGGGAPTKSVGMNQDFGTNTWVNLGTFAMQSGGYVTLTNLSGMTPGKYDVAFDAMAFVPRGGTPGVPIGGASSITDIPTWLNSAFINCACAFSLFADPVNSGNGYFGESSTDITTPGLGASLRLTRTYSSSLADTAGPAGAAAVNEGFGPGWTFGYGMTATTNSTSGTVVILQEDGSRVSFSSNGSGGYNADLARANATLSKSGTAYTFTRRGGEVFSFDTSSGRLSSISDLPGRVASTPYSTSLAYDVNGKLQSVTDPTGRAYAFVWSGSQIAEVDGPGSQKVTYGYDLNGNLSDVYGLGTAYVGSVAGDQDRTQYGYSASHLLTSKRLPANYGKTGSPLPVTSLIYDSSERVTSQTDPMGNLTRFDYGPNTGLGIAAGQTLVTDPSGHKTLDTYSNGTLASETAAYGTAQAASTTYSYDPLTLGVTQVTHPDGSKVSYTYDAAGDRTSTTDELGRISTSIYNQFGQVVRSTTPSLRQTVTTFSSAGVPTSVAVTALSQVVEVPDGNLPTDPVRTETVQYTDAAHPSRATSATDFVGKTSTYTYEAHGYLTSLTDPASNVTKYRYDANTGSLLTTVSPTGVAAGTATNCTPPAVGCTTRSFDAHGRVVSIIDAKGESASSTYDADGDHLTSTDANGHKTTFVYDNDDRVTSTTAPGTNVQSTAHNPDGTISSTANSAGTVGYTYFPTGTTATMTDADGKVTSYVYDSRNRLTATTYPAGNVVHQSWDAAGQLSGLSYSGGSATPSVTFTYTTDGSRATMNDGTGTSSYSYNQFNELVKLTSGAGSTVLYGYDNDGRETSITYPGATTAVTKTYNSAGLVGSITDAGGRSTAFAYTADNALLTTTQPNGDVVTNTFDNDDRLLTTALTRSGTSLGTLTYTRDSMGDVKSATPSAGAPGVGTAFTYNANQYLQTATTTTTANYDYDSAGNATTFGGNTQSFDPAARLCWTKSGSVAGSACASPPTGATAYAYDNNGARTAKSPSAGAATGYAWNGANQLSNISGAVTAAYTYDGDGLRATKTVGSASATFSWDRNTSVPALLSDGSVDYITGPTGTPLEQTAPDGSNPVWYFSDQQGSTTELTNASGVVAGTYSYGEWGQTLSHTGTVATPLQYDGQYLDSETGLIYLRARYLDTSTGQFLSVDPMVAATLAAYLYAANDPLNKKDPLGLWSWNDTLLVAGIALVAIGGILLTVSVVGSPGDVGVVAGEAALGGELAADLTAEAAADTAANAAATAGEEGTADSVDVAATRPSLRVGTKQAIKDAAHKDENGDFFDPNTGDIQPKEGPFDYGHTYGEEWWRTQQMAREEGWSREQLIEYENQPERFQIENPTANRSHLYEKPKCAE